MTTGDVTLHLGDCLNMLPTLAGVDAVVTDPPWGVGQDSDNTRFPSLMGRNRSYRTIAGDDTRFEPSPWLRFPRVALFGANCFSDRLPPGAWLVWCKRREDMLGQFLADAEAVWINRGFGIYLFQHEWHGALRASDRGVRREHPHQKPVAVMKWVLDRLGVPPGAVVLDPYMGSGTTGVACVQTGRRFVGIEIDPVYFAVAEKRLAAAACEDGLFAPAAPQPGLFPEAP
jgi:site-specific DNA-methyltransferase (adenine-specific)